MTTENVFETIDPHDGFRVERVFLPADSGNLSLGLYGYAEMGRDVTLTSHRFPIYEYAAPSEAQKAEYLRRQDLCDAIARYMTLGGTWDGLHDTVDAMQQGFAGAEIPYEGWTLFDAYTDTEGTPTAVWTQDGTSKAARWVDGLFVDPNLTIAALAQEARDADHGEEPTEAPSHADDRRGRPEVRRLPGAERLEDAGAES